MNDALLKQLIAGESVHDVWNHITGDAVTVVYQRGGVKRRLVIGVDRESSKPPGDFYRAASPLYAIGGVQVSWAAEARSAEEAVAAAWNRAKAELLEALDKEITVTPVLEPDSNFPDGPPRFIWPDGQDMWR
ncbi:hypothetical protein [Deinococcus aestuarii]|uniref:hypothetical protein n=1 Tax=Deinococcus aestuarii TaxID=2774531 RepID=UPI001C0B8F6A|nr:hypothetical protein [Deinococcus aestuarii]